MKKYIIIKQKHNTGMDEWWCDWFYCPNCKKETITDDFKFCPNCGIKLRWSKKLTR
jgi:rRNA maturation endonuclease Nob1